MGHTDVYSRQKFVQTLMQAIAVYFLFIPMHRREASPIQPAFSMCFPDRPDVSFKDVSRLPLLGLPPAGVVPLFLPLPHGPATIIQLLPTEQIRSVQVWCHSPCNLYAQPLRQEDCIVDYRYSIAQQTWGGFQF